MSIEAPTNISAAFDILLEAIEEEIDLVERSVGLAADRSEYSQAREAIDRAEQMTGLRDRLSELRGEWERAFPEDAVVDDEDEQIRSDRRDLGRLQRGLRTQQEQYFIPILQVLESMGGSARAGTVINQIGELMSGILKDVDYQPLQSRGTPRWRNAAQWARNDMVLAGLLEANSPYRIWEISDAGRRYLNEHRP